MSYWDWNKNEAWHLSFRHQKSNTKNLLTDEKDSIVFSIGNRRYEACNEGRSFQCCVLHVKQREKANGLTYTQTWREYLVEQFAPLSQYAKIVLLGDQSQWPTILSDSQRYGMDITEAECVEAKLQKDFCSRALCVGYRCGPTCLHVHVYDWYTYT